MFEASSVKRPKGQQMNPDLCDVCGCRGAGGFRGDGLCAQQHPGVHVTISVNLLMRKTLNTLYIVLQVKLPTTTDLLSSYPILFSLNSLKAAAIDCLAIYGQRKSSMSCKHLRKL